MTDHSSASLNIRCPVCLGGHSVAVDTPTTQMLECEYCGRYFEFNNALPSLAKVEKAQKAVADHVAIREYAQASRKLILFALFVIMLLLIGVRLYTQAMDGPDFLWFYLKMFFACWVLSLLIRFLWFDFNWIRLFAFAIFEGSGGIRLINAWLTGASPYSLLMLMMLIGGLLLAVRLTVSTSRGSGGDAGGTSGGCGGCGGCGG